MLVTKNRWTGLISPSRLAVVGLALLSQCGCTEAQQAEVSSPAPFPAVASPVATSGSMPGISGMVLVSPRTYLMIHDSRDSDESRAGLWRLEQRPPIYEAVHICDESLGKDCLADLESIAAIPGREDEFLVLESGAAAKGDRRRLLARIKFTDGEAPQLKMLGWENIWPATSELVNCESMVCWRRDDDYVVMIVDRVASPGKRARCKAVVGSVSLPDDGSVRFAADGAGLGDAPKFIDSPAPVAKSWRACTDLYLDDDDVLWGACAEDRGDAGPFRSLVFRVGTLAPATAQLVASGSVVEYECDGLKVEALARGSIGGAERCFGSDDERFGGAWRTLPIETRSKAQSGR